MSKRSIFRAAALCFAVAIFTSRPVAAEDKEHLVKAAFLYNFVKFVDWPDAKAISQQSRIDICVFGETPLSRTGDIFKAASTAKLALSLVSEDNVRNMAAHCHIAFISKSEAGRVGDVLGALRSQPVLTVSDIPNFAESGGMVGFVENDNKIKVVVNARSASAAGLRVDAQLLEIALKVIDK